MNMGSIVWPKDARAACVHYLDFVLQVVDKLDIEFPDTRPDPRAVVRLYIYGKTSDAAYMAERDAWWVSLDATGQITQFKDPSVLLMRLAICLLSATTDEAPQLGEHLSWFFEVLHFMGTDLREPHAMMERYFAVT